MSLPELQNRMDELMDGFFFIFTSFSTVVQSYQDEGRVIIKGCVEWLVVHGWKYFRFHQESHPGPLYQQTSANPTELPGMDPTSNGKLNFTCSLTVSLLTSLIARR